MPTALRKQPRVHSYPPYYYREKQKWYILDLCVSSLRRGHANLLCIVPILADDLFRGSNFEFPKTI